MDLIPTQYKEKLPKGLSYPLGAKEVSEALFGIPQYPDLKIIFSGKDTVWASKFKEKLKSKSTITLITIDFHIPKISISTSNREVDRGLYDDPKWFVRIYALPSELRSSVNLTLKEKILPELADSLKALAVVKSSDFYSWSYGVNLATGEILRM